MSIQERGGEPEGGESQPSPAETGGGEESDPAPGEQQTTPVEWGHSEIKGNEWLVPKGEPPPEDR